MSFYHEKVMMMIIIFSTLSQVEAATTVLGISGQFLCRGEPVNRQRIQIYSPTQFLDAFLVRVTKNSMNHGWKTTNENGSFEFGWENGLMFKYLPIALIDHQCGETEV